MIKKTTNILKLIVSLLTVVAFFLALSDLAFELLTIPFGWVGVIFALSYLLIGSGALIGITVSEWRSKKRARIKENSKLNCQPLLQAWVITMMASAVCVLLYRWLNAEIILTIYSCCLLYSLYHALSAPLKHLKLLLVNCVLLPGLVWFVYNSAFNLTGDWLTLASLLVTQSYLNLGCCIPYKQLSAWKITCLLLFTGGLFMPVKAWEIYRIEQDYLNHRLLEITQIGRICYTQKEEDEILQIGCTSAQGSLIVNKPGSLYLRCINRFNGKEIYQDEISRFYLPYQQKTKAKIYFRLSVQNDEFRQSQNAFNDIAVINQLWFHPADNTSDSLLAEQQDVLGINYKWDELW